MFLLATFKGISGLRKNALQCATDEILTLNITTALPPVNGEYLAEGTKRLSAAEKKRKGEALRRKVCVWCFLVLYILGHSYITLLNLRKFLFSTGNDKCIKTVSEKMIVKGVNMPGPSRCRDERPWSSFHGVLEKVGSSMER